MYDSRAFFTNELSKLKKYKEDLVEIQQFMSL